MTRSSGPASSDVSVGGSVADQADLSDSRTRRGRWPPARWLSPPPLLRRSGRPICSQRAHLPARRRFGVRAVTFDLSMMLSIEQAFERLKSMLELVYASRLDPVSHDRRYL